MSEAVKVVVRARPLNKKEKTENRSHIITIHQDLGQVILKNPKPTDPSDEKKVFTFDNVYDENSTQRSVYDETAYPLVESVMQGYNGTIFAYWPNRVRENLYYAGRGNAAGASRHHPQFL